MRDFSKMGEKPRTLKIVLNGDREAADRLRLMHGARALYEFRRLTSLQNLKQNERRIDFSDGSHVRLETRFGHEVATFYAPVKERFVREKEEKYPQIVPGFVAFNSVGERIGYLISTNSTFGGPYLTIGPYWNCGLSPINSYYTTHAENALRQRLGEAYNPVMGSINEIWEIDPAAIKSEFSGHYAYEVVLSTSPPPVPPPSEDPPWTGGAWTIVDWTSDIRDSSGNTICQPLVSREDSTKWLRTGNIGADYFYWLFYHRTITGDYYFGQRDAWQSAGNYAHLYHLRRNSTMTNINKWHELNYMGEWHRQEVEVSYQGELVLEVDGESDILLEGSAARAEHFGCRYYKTPDTRETAVVGFFSRGVGCGYILEDDAEMPALPTSLHWAEEIVSGSVVYFAPGGQAEFEYPVEQFTKMDGYQIGGQDVYIDLLFTGGGEYPSVEATYGLFYLNGLEG